MRSKMRAVTTAVRQWLGSSHERGLHVFVEAPTRFGRLGLEHSRDLELEEVLLFLDRERARYDDGQDYVRRRFAVALGKLIASLRARAHRSGLDARRGQGAWGGRHVVLNPRAGAARPLNPFNRCAHAGDCAAAKQASVLADQIASRCTFGGHWTYVVRQLLIATIRHLVATLELDAEATLVHLPAALGLETDLWIEMAGSADSIVARVGKEMLERPAAERFTITSQSVEMLFAHLRAPTEGGAEGATA